MTLLFLNDVKLALGSLRTAKLRSFLTMLGIIIGVVAVVVTVSLGEGVKKQVQLQTTQTGNDLITVRPGQLVRRDIQGGIRSVNLLAGFGANAFTEEDLDAITDLPQAGQVAPISTVSGLPEAYSKTYNEGLIIATNELLPKTLNLKLQYGSFFKEDDANRNVAVIGRRTAEVFFEENVPIGNRFTFRDHEFVVLGTLDHVPGNAATLGYDINSAIFIPQGTGDALLDGPMQIAQILVKPANGGNAVNLAQDITTALQKTHGGALDFTVLTQDEAAMLTGGVLNILTSLVAGIAAVSLIVGGIGIMNIMLVSVTERTREIGIRKTVGATNRQIMGQFVTEATILSLVGGLIGLGLSIIANFLLRIFTNLQPVITIPVVAVGAGVALVVGIIFGTAPAFKAARRDPIDALRHE